MDTLPHLIMDNLISSKTSPANWFQYVAICQEAFPEIKEIYQSVPVDVRKNFLTNNCTDADMQSIHEIHKTNSVKLAQFLASQPGSCKMFFMCPITKEDATPELISTLSKCFDMLMLQEFEPSFQAIPPEIRNRIYWKDMTVQDIESVGQILATA